MITKLTRLAPEDLTEEDWDCLFLMYYPPGQRHTDRMEAEPWTPSLGEYHKLKHQIMRRMNQGDRFDAEIMFARVDAWHDARKKMQ